jgi:hypothetical protein
MTGQPHWPKKTIKRTTTATTSASLTSTKSRERILMKSPLAGEKGCIEKGRQRGRVIRKRTRKRKGQGKGKDKEKIPIGCNREKGRVRTGG